MISRKIRDNWQTFSLHVTTPLRRKQCLSWNQKLFCQPPLKLHEGKRKACISVQSPRFKWVQLVPGLKLIIFLQFIHITLLLFSLWSAVYWVFLAYKKGRTRYNVSVVHSWKWTNEKDWVTADRATYITNDKKTIYFTKIILEKSLRWTSHSLPYFTWTMYFGIP